MTEEPFSSSSFSLAALGDLDDDKKLDAVIFTSDNKIIAYHGTGQTGGKKKIKWGFLSETFEVFAAHPVITDINKDGCSDVIAAGLYGGLYIFNGKNGKILWQQKNAGNLDEAIISTPLIADMGGDKNLDIIVRRADSKFYIITTNVRVPQSTIFWNQVNSNAANTGSIRLITLTKSKYLISIIISFIVIIGLVIVNMLMIMKRKKYLSTV